MTVEALTCFLLRCFFVAQLRMCERCGITDVFDSDTAGTAGGPLRVPVFADTDKGDAFEWGCGIVTHTQAVVYE